MATTATSDAGATHSSPDPGRTSRRWTVVFLFLLVITNIAIVVVLGILTSKVSKIFKLMDNFDLADELQSALGYKPRLGIPPSPFPVQMVNYRDVVRFFENNVGTGLNPLHVEVVRT